jgi:hypothetical protein
MTVRPILLFVLAAWCITTSLAAAAFGEAGRQEPARPPASDRLALAEQNALIRKHCLPCHSDAMPLGALSVEQLDVARAPDSLLAMLVSQITQHLPLATAQASHNDATARAAVTARMRRGAMTAAGLPLPADETIHALIDSLAARTAHAREWNIERNAIAGGVMKDGLPTVTASTVREVLKNEDGPVPIYRLIASCNEQTRVGELRVSWLPFPAAGTVTLTADGGEPTAVLVEKPTTSVVIMRTPLAGSTTHAIPARRLFVAVPQGDIVEFPFATLPPEARRVLTSCFPG